MRTRRPWYLLMLGAVAGPLVLASAAWACANLATLTLDTSSAAAGESVNFTGSRYRESGPAIDGKAENVVLHWNARDGEVLASVPADTSRSIAGTITIPNVPAGNYVVVATQLQANGNPSSGTPGRFPITVEAASSASNSVGSSAPVTEQAPAPAAPQASVAAPEQASAPAAPQSAVAAPEQAPATPAVAAPEQASAPAAPQSAVAAPEQSSAPAAPQAPVPAAPEVAVAPATSGSAAPVALDSSPVASRTAIATPASSGSSLLPLALVGIGLVLSLVSSAMVVANRRSYSLARAAR